MRRLALLIALSLPAAAHAQATPAAQPAPAAKTTPAAQAAQPSADAKYDEGTVRKLDTARSLLICDMPDGPVTYDVSQAQLVDAQGKAAGSATQGLSAGQKIRITYTVGHGAQASEVRILK